MLITKLFNLQFKITVTEILGSPMAEYTRYYYYYYYHVEKMRICVRIYSIDLLYLLCGSRSVPLMVMQPVGIYN
jgi:hypothetical protein